MELRDLALTKAMAKASSGGVDTSDATATESDALEGKTFYANGEKKTGNIPTVGSRTFTPMRIDTIISKGRYLAGPQTIKGDANLVAGNIKSGVSIFGVAGTYEGGGGSGGSTIDEIMQANGYTTESENIVGDQIAAFKAMLDDVVAQIEGESGYLTNRNVVLYFNDAEQKIAFVIQ